MSRRLVVHTAEHQAVLRTDEKNDVPILRAWMTSELLPMNEERWVPQENNRNPTVTAEEEARVRAGFR